jgi:hypothetical protein
MTNSERQQFTLKKGQNFTACSNDSTSCTDKVSTTAIDRSNGDLVVQLDSGGLPVSAVFYFPNQADCTNNGPLLRGCDLEATFEGKELQDLINNSSELNTYQKLIAAKNQSMGDQQGYERTAGDNETGPSQPPSGGVNSTGGIGWLLQPYFFFLIPIVFISILIVYKMFKEFIAPPKASRKAAAYRHQTQPIATQAGSPAISDEIRRQLATMQSQINQLNGKLGNLETELLVMGQKVDLAKPKVSSASFSQTLPLPPVPIAVPQRSMDLNLLKEAVATSNYNLIKNFTHDFITETLESRQGKEESIRFSIDGNQDTSQQRTQSEFIAVPYLNETYLIPNILPNATDPARTIKRLVDRNKVYRGDGQNLLSLCELATVERSGDSYILAKPGRIS